MSEATPRPGFNMDNDFYDKVERRLTWPVSRLLLGKLKLVGDGMEELKENGGPAILAIRHFSNFDSLVVGHAVKQLDKNNRLHFVAKSELDNGYLGRSLGRLGAAFIDRSQHFPDELARSAGNLFINRQLLAIYPEGHRTRTFNETTRRWVMGKLGTAAAQVSLHHGTPIYPVGISGTKIMDGRRGVAVAIGTPLKPQVSPVDFAQADLIGKKQMWNELTARLGSSMLGAQEQSHVSLYRSGH